MKLNIDETKRILDEMNETCRQIILACSKLERNAVDLGENLSDNVSQLSERIVSKIKLCADMETRMIQETNSKLDESLSTMMDYEKNFSKGVKIDHE